MVGAVVGMLVGTGSLFFFEFTDGSLGIRPVAARPPLWLLGAMQLEVHKLVALSYRGALFHSTYWLKRGGGGHGSQLSSARLLSVISSCLCLRLGTLLPAGFSVVLGK